MAHNWNPTFLTRRLLSLTVVVHLGAVRSQIVTGSPLQIRILSGMAPSAREPNGRAKSLASCFPRQPRSLISDAKHNFSFPFTLPGFQLQSRSSDKVGHLRSQKRECVSSPSACRGGYGRPSVGGKEISFWVQWLSAYDFSHSRPLKQLTMPAGHPPTVGG